ncbi:MAG: hypothetical protein RLZZ28_2352 [Bacteroidota bacterium]|jgi:hypothetical protein
MKFIITLALTGFLAFVCGVYSSIPWWSFAITSLIVSMAIHQKPAKAFWSGFLGLFLLWTVLALLKDSANDHILSAKVATILPLGGSSVALVLVTGLLGGLVSGLASLTGSYLRKTN